MKSTVNMPYILAISLVSAMGGLLFGYDWVVIGGAKPFYERYFDLVSSPNLQGWAMSSALIGCLLGAGISGRMTDKYGRKSLMLFGAAGLAFIYILMAIAYFMHIKGIILLILVITAIAVYGMSLAPVTWVILSEIFPNKMRGQAMAMATLSLWIACLVLTYTFPFLNKILGPSGTFGLYSLICILGFSYIFKALPETRGKSLEEIEKELT